MKSSRFLAASLLFAACGRTGFESWWAPSDAGGPDTSRRGDATPAGGGDSNPLDGGDATPGGGGDANPLDGGDATPVDGGDANPFDGGDTTRSGGDTGQAPASLAIYRSVGPGSVAPLASGGGGATLTIGAGEAVFSAPLPDRVGLGDAVEYDSNGDGGVDALAFVHGRSDAWSYQVRSANGRDAPPAVGAATTWSVRRAYTSLSDVQSGNENAGIDAGLRDFDAHANGADLVALEASWQVACYADAVDTAPVLFAGWTTSPICYLRLFTPTAPAEVGVSQRHAGVWSAAGYQLEVTNATALRNEAAYARIEGLQVHSIANIAGSLRGVGIMNAATTAGQVSISHNLIRATHSGATSDDDGIRARPVAGSVTRVWNNIIYDFNYVVATGACINLATGDGVIYSNTVVNCRAGILSGSSAGGEVIRNNLVYGNALDTAYRDFSFIAGGAYGGNLSSDGTSPDAALRNQSVAFVDLAGRDLHLGPGASAPIGQGLDLTADLGAAVADDVDGDPRPQAADIGADQRVP